MTPSEYLDIEREQQKIIAVAKRKIFDARELADKSAPPTNRRDARADDIAIGAIIWHKRDPKDGGDYWNIVSGLLHYGDSFKAYEADDGCRYGLDGAYIETARGR